MVFKRYLFGGLCMFIAVLAAIPLFSHFVAGKADTVDVITSRLLSDQPLANFSTTVPNVEKPSWYYKINFTYTVSTSGIVTSDFNEFATLANATLNDPRGWSQLGVQFKQVTSGGMFNLILSQADNLPLFSFGCSVYWSCSAGNSVIINDDRWASATTAWNNAGGSLRDYRHMVVNHEVGHWLGHGHSTCSGAGNLAAVMQQQSIDLQGCAFNPWPLPSELWSTRI
jgi:hypothetical protein